MPNNPHGDILKTLTQPPSHSHFPLFNYLVTFKVIHWHTLTNEEREVIKAEMDTYISNIKSASIHEGRVFDKSICGGGSSEDFSFGPCLIVLSEGTLYEVTFDNILEIKS